LTAARSGNKRFTCQAANRQRSRRYRKRGGGAQQVTFDEAAVVAPERSADFIALDDALTALAQLDQRQARVVELRFFGGLTIEETAEVLKVAPITVRRDWSLAQPWLLRELRRGTGGPCSTWTPATASRTSRASRAQADSPPKQPSSAKM